MEKGFESWQQKDPNLLGDPGFQNIPCLGNMHSSNGKFGKPEQPCGWFTPVVNSVPKGQLPQKKFLVFDQSNERTTLIYSSMHHPPEPQFTFDRKKEASVIEKHEDTRSPDSFHEDTEELEALLYSDDDGISDSGDEEEQSTGHSPVMDWPEEVASSAGCKKRRKLDSGVYDVEDTASSGVNCSGEGELSSCGNNGGAEVPELESESKRPRKEKVRETISVLQNLIPGGKNAKDAMVILDEAINYLRILKVKAQALGLDSL